MSKGIAILAATALGLSACGGSGNKPLSATEQGKLANGFSTITDYCISQVRSQMGSGTGGQLGQLSQAVDDMVGLYKDHGNVSVQVTPTAPKKPFKAFLRDVQTQLGTGNCAPDQATKIDKAISG